MPGRDFATLARELIESGVPPKTPCIAISKPPPPTSMWLAHPSKTLAAPRLALLLYYSSSVERFSFLKPLRSSTLVVVISSMLAGRHTASSFACCGRSDTAEIFSTRMSGARRIPLFREDLLPKRPHSCCVQLNEVWIFPVVIDEVNPDCRE